MEGEKEPRCSGQGRILVTGSVPWGGRVQLDGSISVDGVDPVDPDVAVYRFIALPYLKSMLQKRELDFAIA